MGIVSRLSKTKTDESDRYTELDSGEYGTGIEPKTRMWVHFMKLMSEGGLSDVKKLIEGVDIVMVDISYIQTYTRRTEPVIKDLQEVAEEAGGNIFWDKPNQIIMTPEEVGINSEPVDG